MCGSKIADSLSRSAAINSTVNWQPHAMKMVVSVNEASV